MLTHTFSLNGYITYMHLQRLIEEGEGAPFFIRGGICDSGPGPWTWSSNIYFPWGGNTGYLGLRQRPNPNFPAFAFFWISAAVEKRGIVRSVRETAQLLMLFRENFKKYHPQGYLRYGTNSEMPEYVLLFLPQSHGAHFGRRQGETPPPHLVLN